MNELGKCFNILLQVDKRNCPEKYQPERSKREDSVKCEICGYPKKYQGKLAVHCNC